MHFFFDIKGGPAADPGIIDPKFLAEVPLNPIPRVPRARTKKARELNPHTPLVATQQPAGIESAGWLIVHTPDKSAPQLKEKNGLAVLLELRGYVSGALIMWWKMSITWCLSVHCMTHYGLSIQPCLMIIQQVMVQCNSAPVDVIWQVSCNKMFAQLLLLCMNAFWSGLVGWSP